MEENKIKEVLQSINNRVEVYKEIFEDYNDFELFEESYNLIKEVENKVSEALEEGEFKKTNAKLYKEQLDKLIEHLYYTNKNQIGEDQREKFLTQYKDYHIHEIREITKNLILHIRLSHITENFGTNIVMIGANGSGKTTLAEKLKGIINKNGTIISAQRVLKLPNIDRIDNIEKTEDELKREQSRSKTYKKNDDFLYIDKEFEKILRHLISEHSSTTHKNWNTVKRNPDNAKEKIAETPNTKLEETLEIWNSLITHRNLYCEDGFNIKVSAGEKQCSYPCIQMSDGEKVLLFIISQVMLAPKEGFVVIDEPEMYLHKTIVKQAWDILESKRNDCIFIYLTHDLDFAISRNNAKKIWIKSYLHPDQWEFEEIESEIIPKALLFEILGSRKNILFCEGDKGSIDERIYSLLFPNLTITPVGSCFNVINHTKAFNKLNNINTRAFGLIDSDHHSNERLNKIKDDNIFHFSVSEVENLFLDEDFLKALAERLLCNGDAVLPLIKEEIIKQLEKDKELQISNYISAKINNFFKDSDISKGNTFKDVEDNYNSFLNKIDLNEFYKKRKEEIELIVKNKDYEKAISVYNNKGLKSIPSKHLNIKGFTDRCFSFIKEKPESINLLKKYFPEDLFI